MGVNSQPYESKANVLLTQQRNLKAAWTQNTSASVFCVPNGYADLLRRTNEVTILIITTTQPASKVSYHED
jgi:hypothetical protein